MKRRRWRWLLQSVMPGTADKSSRLRATYPTTNNAHSPYLNPNLPFGRRIHRSEEGCRDIAQGREGPRRVSAATTQRTRPQAETASPRR
jgi:hypothetical protein